MRETICLFQFQDSAQIAAIRKLAGRMKITVRVVEPMEYHLTIGMICERKSSAGTGALSPVNLPKETLMLFCNLTEKHFDRMLALLREEQLKVDYKAVLTDTNAKWRVPELYLELHREKMILLKQMTRDQGGK